MLTITGNTFQHREFLKSIRARFDPVRKCWTHDGALAAGREAELRGLAGIIVSGDTRPTKPLWIGIDLAADAVPSPKVTFTGPPALHGNSRWLDHFALSKCNAHFGFDSIAHQLDFMRDMPTHDCIGRETDDRAFKFTGTRSWSEAFEMLEHGTWSEGMELADEIIDYFSARNAQQRRRKIGYVGGNVSVGRMLAGNPKHMVSRPKRDGRKVVTLFVDVSMHTFIKTENAIIRAALVAALCDLLENHGYSCEIVAVDAATHNRKAIYTLTVDLKQAGDRLNLNDIIFALGHPSYLRRLLFSIVCSEPATRVIWNACMGQPVAAFNDRHGTSPREIYIGMLKIELQGYLKGSPIERALKMFKWIVPKDFPIEVKQ